MSEQQSQMQRPTGADDREYWRNYWSTYRWMHRIPQLTESEIDAARQAYLAERRAIKPDIVRGIYPFKDVEPKLTRADVEWLLATHDDRRGPVVWDEEKDKPDDQRRVGLDLRGADLRGVDLIGLPLARVRGSLTFQDGSAFDEQQEAAVVHLEGAYLFMAHLEGATLEGAHLERAPLRLGMHREGTNLQESGAHLSRAHLEGADLYRAHLEGADLADAHLEGAELGRAHLERAHLIRAHLEGATLGGAHLEGADLGEAHLDGARLDGAHLEGADLGEAHLDGANLRVAHLAEADLEEAQLSGANLTAAQLAGANLRGATLAGKRLTSDELAQVRTVLADFPDKFPPADLRYAFLDTTTTLNEVTLGDGDLGFVAVADVRWGGVNLAVVPWSRIPGKPPRKRLPWVMLGDEREARETKDREGKRKDAATRLAEFEAAARANRQLATVLRAQGLNDDADRFAYQAQVLQRQVLRRQGRYGAAFFSWVLDRLAGHGYKPGRTVLWYLAVIAAFTVTYFLLGPGEGHAFSPQGALVFSVTSFHGRGFFPGSLSLEDLVTQLAAIEAVFGLFIEVSFIATFTQRFFAR